MTIREAVSAVLEIQSASGTNAKKDVIRRYAEDEQFKKLLYYALNPMLTYNVSEETLRFRTYPDFHIAKVFPNIFTVCERLSARRGLDDLTVNQVGSFLDIIPSDETETEFYIQLLSKTLRLGVTAKTVNKVIPGLIPEWEVQQAFPLEKYPFKPGTPFWLTQKLNGVRATYYKGRLYARSGAPYEGLDHIVSILEAYLGDRFVADGELTLFNRGEMSDNEAFRVATGIINSDAPEKPEICYTVFDMIQTSEFDGECFTPYYDRRQLLDGSFLDEGPDSPVRVLPPLYYGTDQAMIEVFLDRMVREDKEGVMVNLNVPYQRKRHRGILKVKRFYTMDLPIVGAEEGNGKFSGMLGALILDFKGNELRVGSGFTDEQRAEFWSRREDLPGTLCEVKYKEISSDKKTGQESLQFPVFIALRPDKNSISYA